MPVPVRFSWVAAGGGQSQVSVGLIHRSPVWMTCCHDLDEATLNLNSYTTKQLNSYTTKPFNSSTTKPSNSLFQLKESIDMHCRTCAKELVNEAAVCVGCGCPPLTGRKFCQSCGADTNPDAVACVKCGVALRSGVIQLSLSGGDRIAASDPPKDPVVMGLLSGCLIAGLGQMVLGQTVKGIAFLLGSMVLGAVTLGASILITWPLGGVDAYLIAKKLKEGKTVGQWECF